MSKYDEADARVKTLHVEVSKPTVALPEFEALGAQKKDLDSKLEASLRKISDQDAQIQKLTEAFQRQSQEMEEAQTALKVAIASGAAAAEEEATVASLRSELSSLREQLSRQVAINTTAPKAARPEGGAFNMATGRAVENGASAAPVANQGLPPTGKRRAARRHSDVGTEMQNGAILEDERWDPPRAVSVAFPQESVKRLANNKGYLPDVYDDPAEEIMKLLEDEEPLDEDVLAGIIRHLKIPSPNLTNPPSPKEVLFPAHLISLVTNEMWKYGMMRESERFLANVMQTVQQHVMVGFSLFP